MRNGWRLWLALLLAGLLGGLVALGAERGVQRLTVQVVPTATPADTPTPNPPAIVIERVTIVPSPVPTSPPNDVQGQQLLKLQQQVAQHEGLILVVRAQQHVALAGDALQQNDLNRANQELVAAHADLDRAVEHLPQDLKQVVDNERRAIGQVRADLYVAPEGLDDRMRAMQDQLLALATP